MRNKNTTAAPPGEIVNAVVAARRAGDRQMERTGRGILARDYGIRVIFARGGMVSISALPARRCEVVAQ